LKQESDNAQGETKMSGLFDLNPTPQLIHRGTLTNRSSPQKQRALVLCLLLGFFGAHRFYLHQNSTGLAYLLFCWTLVPVLFSLIDAIFLAQMTDEEFQEEYCAFSKK
jgi:TM2 domain-containing membrane protein YozV